MTELSTNLLKMLMITRYKNLRWAKLILCVLPLGGAHAVTSLSTETVAKSVVFFFTSTSPHDLSATGFLITVPKKTGAGTYSLLVTARHVVDPVWAGCAINNPAKLFIRVNKMRRVSSTNETETGVAYLPIELTRNGSATWKKSDDDSVDVAVLNAPPELSSGDYDVTFLSFRNFGKPDEIARIGVGSQTTSAGLVPGLEGKNRNNPIFHFGKIASIPDEAATLPPCRPGSQPHAFRVWWVATTLVPGTSGSPIFFDPLFPPNADITAGEPRAMIIGLQSVSVGGGDLAGMTPAKYLTEVISRVVLQEWCG